MWRWRLAPIGHSRTYVYGVSPELSVWQGRGLELCALAESVDEAHFPVHGTTTPLSPLVSLEAQLSISQLQRLSWA